MCSKKTWVNIMLNILKKQVASPKSSKFAVRDLNCAKTTPAHYYLTQKKLKTKFFLAGLTSVLSFPYFNRQFHLLRFLHFQYQNHLLAPPYHSKPSPYHEHGDIWTCYQVLVGNSWHTLSHKWLWLDLCFIWNFFH